MMTKRIVSLLLAVMMIVAVIPAGIISISAKDTTYTDVVFTPDSWLCETDPKSEKSKVPMATEDGTNFYYPDPRVPEDPRGAEIGSSDEGIITSVDDYIFAGGFKFTFDANVCRAGCAAWKGTLFSISFGTDVNFEVSIKDGYKLTVNGKTYTKNPKVACTNSWNYTPTNDAEANKINGTYTVEYMDGKVTVKFNGDAIDFGQDILIDAKNFEAGKIQFEKGWSWTKANITNAEQLAASDYKVDFRIFSNVTLSLPGEHIHTYGEYVSNNDATCAKDATKTATCTVEGCGQTNTVIIPDSALGHNFVSDKNGTTKTCSVCGITLAAVEFTPDSWLCEKYPNRPTSTYPMATEDGKNFYYQAPRGDEKSSSNNEIGSSDEGLITSVDDYIFADGFKFTFDANVCRAGCKTWGVTLFTISFGTAVKLEVGIGDGKGYQLTVNGTTYTMNPWPPCFENWAPKDEDAANLINGIYTIEYMDGKVTVELNGKAIDFGQDILIDAEDFAAGKIQFEKGWTWTKVAKDSYDPKDYATDFLIFSDVALVVGVGAETEPEETESIPAETESIPAETESIPAETETEPTSFDVTWSADNGVIAVNGNSYAVPAKIENGRPKINQTWKNTAGGNTSVKYAVLNKFKVRSNNALDLSDGFKLSFDALLLSTGGGQQCWNYIEKEGYKFLEVTIGELLVSGSSASYDKVKCIKFEIDDRTDSYILTVNGKSTTVEMPSKGSENTEFYTVENAPDYNKSYSIEYKNGYVVVYGNGEEIARCALADASILENARITIRTREESIADMTAYTTEYADGIGRVTVFSNVKLEKISEEPEVPAPVAPVYEGVQDGMVNDVFSVRFVGTVKDLNYSEVGFKITAMDGAKAKSWTKSTNIVYSKLIGNTDTGIVEYTKENLSGEYIYALTIQGVPTEGTVTFNVTTYGIVDGVEVEGTTYAVTYTDGVYVDTVVA